MNSDLPYDGGPAFPSERGNVPEDSEHGHARGMSKRELFAAILMHSEAVTCGVPGEAADALVKASIAAGTDVIEHMAMNAVQGADALLRALDAPQPTQYREMYPDDLQKVAAAERLANIVEALQKAPGWADLPEELRIAARNVAIDVLEPPLPF